MGGTYETGSVIRLVFFFFYCLFPYFPLPPLCHSSSLALALALRLVRALRFFLCPLVRAVLTTHLRSLICFILFIWSRFYFLFVLSYSLYDLFDCCWSPLRESSRFPLCFLLFSVGWLAVVKLTFQYLMIRYLNNIIVMFQIIVKLSKNCLSDLLRVKSDMSPLHYQPTFGFW